MRPSRTLPKAADVTESGIFEKLKPRGTILGVISNWDSRLSDTLSSVGLAPYFDFILASAEIGSAKPEAKIIQEPLRKSGEDPGQAPSAVHPVARTHDETGRRALYVCGAFTRHFIGWSREESKPLLDYLYRHSVRPEFQTRHVWNPGDLIMWDNRSLLHFAVHDHAEDEQRSIHRVQVEGPVPL